MTTLGILACAHLAEAGWWGTSAASLPVRGVTLGMSLDAVAKLHPELHEETIDESGVVGGRAVPYDPSLVTHRLKDSGSCAEECFYVDFASAKLGGAVDDLYLMQELPPNTNIADLLADMEKKYGSPTDLQQNNDVPDDSATITATWGMTIDASSVDEEPQSGQALRIELKSDGSEAEVSFFLDDFTVEFADHQARQDFLAQAAAQQANQANKTLNY